MSKVKITHEFDMYSDSEEIKDLHNWRKNAAIVDSIVTDFYREFMKHSDYEHEETYDVLEKARQYLIDKIEPY